ncbi:MAG: hypothetical protein RLZ98_3599, partial [Pseudomonadota bacterium]
RGGVEEVSFGAATDQGGLPVSNRDRDSSRRLIAARATWEFKPTLFAFAEAGGDERTFDAASRNDGILRDSSGRYVKTGVGFGNSGAFLRGEIGIGYRRQDLADRRLEDVDGLLLDADLAWRINAFSSLRLRSLTEFVDTTLADSGGALARRIELAYRHELRRHLIATGGLAYSWQTFSGRELSEHTISALLGLDYYVSRDVALFARYQHTDFDSGDGARDYVDDTFGIGVRIRR